MKMLLLILIANMVLLLSPAEAQQSQMNWTHVYQESGKEIIITEFYAQADSVLIQYECSPELNDHLELRSRPIIQGVAADTSYIRCPVNVKITASTVDSTIVDYVPQKMLRRLTEAENPDWFN